MGHEKTSQARSPMRADMAFPHPERVAASLMGAESRWRYTGPSAKCPREISLLRVAQLKGDIADFNVLHGQKFDRQPQAFSLDKLRIGEAGLSKPAL